MPATSLSAVPSRRQPIPSPAQAAGAPHPNATPRPVRRDQAASPKRGRLTVRECPPVQNLVPIQNRVRVLLVHIPRLSIQGQARLAAEVGVSRSTVSRLVNGRINPSYRLARGVTTALERFLGRPLDMREVFSTDGTYPTPSGCALCRCGGCLPEEAYDREGDLRPEWRGQRPGDWSLTPLMGWPLTPSTGGDVPLGTEGDACSGKEKESGKEGK